MTKIRRKALAFRRLIRADIAKEFEGGHIIYCIRVKPSVTKLLYGQRLIEPYREGSYWLDTKNGHPCCLCDLPS